MAYSAPPTQSTGDIIGATAWNRLVANDIWLADEHPFCQASRSSFQSVTNVTNVTLTFNANVIDNSAMHSTSVNTSRFTIPIDGWYRCTASVFWESNATGLRLVSWQSNGSGGILAADSRAAVNGLVTYQQVVAEIPATVGSYLEVVVFQSSGGTISAVTGTYATVQWIRT